MSSLLHAVVGGLLLHHQQVAVPSVVCPLSRACCTTATTTTTAAVASGSGSVVRRFGGLRRQESALSSGAAFVKSPCGGTRFVTSSPGGGGGGGSGRRGGAAIMPRSWLSKLGFGGGNSRAAQADPYNSPAHGPDDDKPAPGLEFATFGAGCFWGPELAFQRVAGVSRTEVGYSQGLLHNPSYGSVCEGDTGHTEVVRVHYDPAQCSYENLLAAFWNGHDPSSLNRQGGDVGTQYRSGIYFYSPEQETAAKETLESHQAKIKKKVVTEILPAKKFYRAEEYHQQYLSKGGRFGFRQSAEKGCNDPIRCYG